MSSDLFNRALRADRRDRAARTGVEMFLYERAFEDCLDRISAIQRDWTSILLIGCPDPVWAQQLRQLGTAVTVVDPCALFATNAGGIRAEEDRHDYGIAVHDLVIAIGTLDTVNDLPVALKLIRRSMTPDAAFIGAIAGGDSLPALRAALLDADRMDGRIAARTHPRIDPSTLGALLSSAGFNMPVVDIDRVSLNYRSLDDIVRDLRGMGATNQMSSQLPLSGAKWRAAKAAFAAAAIDGKTAEQIDILHFLAWSDNMSQPRN